MGCLHTTLLHDKKQDTSWMTSIGGPQKLYCLLNQLETSASREIWTVQDTITKRIMVAKISRTNPILEMMAENPTKEKVIYDRLRREGKQHKNILNSMDSFYIKPHLVCVVLEFAECPDLMNKILENKGLGEETSRFYFIQVIDALKFLHAQKICHLDISPENILLTKEQRVVKLADFGHSECSRFVVQKKRLKKKQKIRYRCPELQEDKSIIYDGQKADIWSLGVTLWVMLTGKFCYDIPVLTDSGFAKIAKGYNEIKAWLYKCGGSTNYSEDLLDLLVNLLQLNPLDRPTIDQVLKHKWCTK